MKREARLRLSEDNQQAKDQYTQILQCLEDLFPVTWRNYLSDLYHFITWCERSWRGIQEDLQQNMEKIAWV